MENNEKRWVNLKLPKTSLITLFWFLLLSIPSWFIIQDICKLMTKKIHEESSFSSLSFFFYPYIIAVIIFFFITLLIIVFKNDMPKKYTKGLFTIKGVIDIYVITILFMIASSMFFCLFNPRPEYGRMINYLIGIILGFTGGIIGLLFSNAIKDEFKKEKTKEEN